MDLKRLMLGKDYALIERELERRGGRSGLSCRRFMWGLAKPWTCLETRNLTDLGPYMVSASIRTYWREGEKG